MKIKTIIIHLILFLGAFQAIASTFSSMTNLNDCSDFKAEVIRTGCAPDGWVAIQVTGGTAPYSSTDATYEGDGLFEETDLEPGTYTWTFRDRNGCQVDVTFTIGDECCFFNASVIGLGDAPDGWVAIQVTGGTPPYTSTDATYEGNGLFEETDLEAGTYTWTFRDRNGCEVDVTFTIEDAECDLSAEVVNSGCAPDGWVAIQVTGGTAPYISTDATYEGDGLFEETDLAEGTYTWTFRDRNGCEVDVTFMIGDECCDFAAEVITSGCAPGGSPVGWVAIQVTGGTPPYSSTDATYEGDGLFEELDLDGGTYTWTFVDRNGCEVDVTFTIEEDICCDYRAEVVNSGCAPDGWVAIQVSGGTPPYTSNDAEEVGNGLFEEVDIQAGTYTYTFEDSNGCLIDVTHVVGDGIQAQVTHIGKCAPEGWVAIQVTGGTPPYTSSDATYEGDGLFEELDLAAGTYSWTFEDSNGCEDDVTFNISEELVAEVEFTQTAGCGIVQVQVTGGTPPYSNSYNNVQNTTGTFLFGLEDYANEIIFTDANGCQVKVSLEEFFDFDYCEDFVAIQANENNAQTIDMWSGVDATLFTRFETFCVPDRVVISVNGTIVVDRTAGTGGLFNCNSTGNSVEIDSFCVSTCDRVRFQFFGDVCTHWCGLFTRTAWNFSVIGCKPKDIDVDKAAFLRDDEIAAISMRNPEELSSQRSVEIHPNPTSDFLNINNLNNQLSVLRIINNAGQTLISKDISEQNQVKLDIRSIPSGIYFLEIVNDNGNPIIEKFVKN